MLSGSIVALITPMATSGEVDWAALERLIGWHLDNGTNGIVSVGTTGESATLTVPEHLEVVRRTVEVVGGRIPVIAGTGGNATAEAIYLTQEAERLGVDACLLVTPYYNRPTQEGLVHHFTAIAEATKKPLMLYNVPPRTACDMQAETVARLAPIDNIIGIKEACGDPERVSAIRNLVSDNFTILSGEDGQTLRMMELGAVGAISVTANVLPRTMTKFCRAYLDGDVEAARHLDEVLQPIHEILFVESNPTPAKWALYEMGKVDKGIRLPLLELSEQHRAELLVRLKIAEAL
ncbi:MAG: 4-hydroxy-tetrahydrodipicolinate synthase [Gammaproteobacteria bacterium]|nr:4-hydroxy-tetrahydrodipicolinate synthase [Gammaproteobacteria bacterium]